MRILLKITSNALVTLVAAKEDCFQKPFKTIEAVRISISMAGSKFQTAGPA